MSGWGNADLHQRAMQPIKSRRKCHCGCNGAETHLGTANGVGLTSGCELYVRRWVKNWRNAVSTHRRVKERLAHNDPTPR